MTPVAVTVGTFDGVHLGHRRLLRTAADLAAGAGLDLVALTFDRHPLSLLHPERAPRLLTGLDHKLELLGGVPGVARVEVLAFDHARAEQLPGSFVADTLVGELGARLLVVGGNFRFGRGGAGDVALARELGAAAGLRVVGATLLEGAPGSIISSSEIRRLVAEGHLARAGELLGRPHEVRGLLRRLERPGSPDGRSEWRVVVSPELLLPPPGHYDVRAGLAGEEGPTVVLVPARALVPAPADGPAVVLERPPGTHPHLPDAWRAGATVRIVFEAVPAPVTAPAARDASGDAGDR